MKVLEDAEVKKKICEMCIRDRRKTDQYDSLLKKWKKDTTVKLHKKVWEKISFIDQGVTLKQEEEEDYAVGSDQNATNN